ncbi:MAG: GGDEF domain-containing protein [Candidatus Omnitrophica bacterium]|jgi:diguanylate cyclase (GGDEF)-like protein|nr:GGDEF domain-containing protein [Candidatus Omnitrophota bacterium]MDD5661113.1 GGDEF domain-containing protein [Candidatus Omnitrophota bacterium]
MFNLIALALITLSWFMLVRNITLGFLKRLEDDNSRLLDNFKALEKLQKSLYLENEQLNKTFEDTLALYELTKDICSSLEEEKVFSIFNSSLKKYIGIGDCRYIKDDADLIKYKDYMILPLNIEEGQAAGYLAVDRILEADKEKFGILTQQFLIGLRRALLYQKVQGLTITDTLTQVYCRRYFLERFAEELKRSKKNKLHLSFLMIDIDNFKKYNDRYGHLVGDVILRQVSKIITDNIRQIDFIGRYGGEELSIVLAETGKEQANFAGQRIRQAIEAAAIRAYDEELRVTVSIGVSTFPVNTQNMKDLIEMADQALYLAKETGKNRVCFSPS